MIDDMIRNHGKPYTIERYTETTNSIGNSVKSWGFHISITGIIRMLSASEQVSAGQNNERSTHRLYVNGSLDIEATDRLKDGSKVYDVYPPNDVMGMGEFMQIELIYRGYENG